MRDKKEKKNGRIGSIASVRFQAWLFRILLILNLIPLAVIAFYAHPQADDFAFSNYPHHAWEETHSLISFLGGCMKQFHWNYFSWQGCYSAVILGTLDPLAFGERFYVLVPFLLIGLLVLSNFVFWRTLVFHLYNRGASGKEKGVKFKSDAAKKCSTGYKDDPNGKMKNIRALADAIASIACIAQIQLVPRALDMFFWWDGAVNYLPFFSFLQFLLAILIRLFDNGKLPAGFVVIGMFLSFVFVGGNYSTALVNLLMLLISGIFCLLSVSDPVKHSVPAQCPDQIGNQRKDSDPENAKEDGAKIHSLHGKWVGQWLLILAAGGFGLALSILAPGNALRVADEGASGITSIPLAILTSIRLAVDSIQDNFSVLLLLFLLMAAPFFWKIAGLWRENDTADFCTIPVVLLITVGLFLIYASSFAPSVYVYGDGGPMRLEDVRFLYLVFFLMLEELTLIGALRGFLRDKYPGNPAVYEAAADQRGEFPSGNSSRGAAQKRSSEAEYDDSSAAVAKYLSGILILAVLVTGFYYVIPRENREKLTSVCAARSLLIGEAKEYDRQMKNREALLNDPSTDGEDVVIPALTVRPRLLFLSGLEMEEDPGNWINQTVAEYYDKKSVVIDDSDLGAQQ